MKKKVKLKEEWVQRLLLSYGTRKKLADKSKLSAATVANMLNGGTAGEKARENIFQIAKGISSDVERTDVFLVE